MTTNNHPANGPVSLERLHQISEILSKAAAQSDGGNLGYAMADAVKVIDGVIAARKVEAIYQVMYGECWQDITEEQYHDHAIHESPIRIVYTTPPAPVSPDKMTVEMAYPRVQTNWHDAKNFAEGWNACRSAMLQAVNFLEIPNSSTNNCREISETSTNEHEIETHTLLKSIEGMEVSVDVSTCDADAGHRYFGTVTEISELDTAKNGYILLVQDAKPNFKQAVNHTEQHLDMVDHFVDANEKVKDVTLINEGNIPATQINPVADLYGITSPTGSETTFTFDASEASSFVGSDWSVQEYVELERYQQAVAGNYPVTPGCSCRTCRPVTFTDSRFVVCPECENKRCPHANDHRNACTGSNEPGQEGSAYPAAPQQEVKSE